MNRITLPNEILTAAAGSGTSSRNVMNIRNIIDQDGEVDSEEDESIKTNSSHFSGGSSDSSSTSNSGNDTANNDDNDEDEEESEEENENSQDESQSSQESDEQGQQQQVDDGALGYRRLPGFIHVGQTPFANMIDLAADYQDSTIIRWSDDTFGAAKNLIKTTATPPHSNVQPNEEDEFRDGWLVKRHANVAEATVKFGARGIIRGIDIDLRGYDQCAPLKASVYGYVGETPLLENVDLVPNSHNFFEIINNTQVHSYVLLTVTPGGGVARLRCYGGVVAAANAMGHMEFNLASTKLGAEIIQQPTDIVRGEFPNLIINRSESNQDGWISPRKHTVPFGRSKYTIIKLAGKGAIDRILVDTAHFIGNAPRHVSIQGCCIVQQVDPRSLRNSQWIDLVSEDNAIVPHSCNVLPCIVTGPITHIRYCPIPDGGVQQIIVKGNIFGSEPELPQRLPSQPKVLPPKKRKYNNEEDHNDHEHTRKSSRTRRPVSRFQ